MARGACPRFESLHFIAPPLPPLFKDIREEIVHKHSAKISSLLKLKTKYSLEICFEAMIRRTQLNTELLKKRGVGMMGWSWGGGEASVLNALYFYPRCCNYTHVNEE